MSHRTNVSEKQYSTYPVESVNYWLHTWLGAHRHALQSASERTLFLGYEQLCRDGERVFSQLYALLGIDGDASRSANQYVAAKSEGVKGAEGELLRECEGVFEQLNQRQFETLGQVSGQSPCIK